MPSKLKVEEDELPFYYDQKQTTHRRRHPNQPGTVVSVASSSSSTHRRRRRRRKRSRCCPDVCSKISECQMESASFCRNSVSRNRNLESLQRFPSVTKCSTKYKEQYHAIRKRAFLILSLLSLYLLILFYRSGLHLHTLLPHNLMRLIGFGLFEWLRGYPSPDDSIYSLALARNRTEQRQQLPSWTREWQQAECHGGNIVPNYTLQANHGVHYHPLYNDNVTTLPVLHYSMTDMRLLVQHQCPTIFHRWRADFREHVVLWALCSLYHSGGYLFGANVRHTNEYRIQATRVHQRLFGIGSTTCPKGDWGMAVWESDSEWSMLVVTPRHPLLKCAMEAIGSDENKNVELGIQTLFLHQKEVWEKSNIFHGKGNDDEQEDLLILSGCPLPVDPNDQHPVTGNEPTSCCPDLATTSVDNFRQYGTAGMEVAPSSFLLSTRRRLHSNSTNKTPRFHLDIHDTTAPRPTPAPKTTLTDILWNKNGCWIGQWCSACLQEFVTSYGTFQKCAFICPACVGDTLCSPQLSSYQVRTIELPVHMTLTEHTIVQEQQQRRIPRIVHQTWFEPITADRYPDFSRLANSWRYSGWDYRFYTDSDARAYIGRHYPAAFLEAFDALVPGAYKADLFRYLLLLKDGGIYADADLLLEVGNLDDFVTPNLGFVAPLDRVGWERNESFCFWNGLLGAAPGHPFLVRAVEKVVTHVLNRYDLLDIERDMCLMTPGFESWRSRRCFTLHLSGPCLMGFAANEAMGREPTASYQPGWIIMNSTNSKSDYDGDVLLLHANFDDFGAVRFTDLDRNLMVVSTDFEGLQESKTPISAIVANPEADERPNHYSVLEFQTTLFGTEGVYIDQLVTNEQVKIHVHREKIR